MTSDTYANVSYALASDPIGIQATECPICLGPHEEETHAATVSVRRWLHSQIEKYLV